MILAEQNQPPSWMTVTVAAAIGAIAASVFSGLAMILNGTLERRAREQEARLEREARKEQSARERSANRKQVLMQEAAKLADWKLGLVMKISDQTQQPVSLRDPIVMTEKYYQWLTRLWKHGKLPADPSIQH